MANDLTNEELATMAVEETAPLDEPAGEVGYELAQAERLRAIERMVDKEDTFKDLRSAAQIGVRRQNNGYDPKQGGYHNAD